MHWLRDNWQVKLLALALAIGLWLVIYFNPPTAPFYPDTVPPNGTRLR